MRKLTFIALALVNTTLLLAQNKVTSQTGSSVYILCTGFSKTIPVRDMPVQTEEQRRLGALHKEEVEARREAMKRKFPDYKKRPQQPDPVVQSTKGTNTISAPIVNVDGQVMNSGCPPDPDGAVGPTEYVEAINSSYQVFDKTGAALTGAIDLGTLFPGSSDNGDPIVLYDKFADRWFVSEFEISTTPIELLIAISQTNDAGGAYYIYRFQYSGWTGGDFPDYPKYSIWSDGYYMTSQWPLSGTSAPGVTILDRARMIAGKASAGLIFTPVPTPPSYFGGNNSLGSAAKTLDCDASALPPYGTPNYLTFFQNVNSGGYSDIIYFYKLVTDTVAKTLTITKSDSLTPASFNALFGGTTTYADINQPGSPNSLDALDGTFNFRVPFMEFTGYNSVVLCNTVNTGGEIAGVRWYEVRQSGPGQPWSIYQQGTYAPGDSNSRWNASIGMDQDGDIGLEYSVSSDSVYPSIRYTGRFPTDPLGKMTGIEQTVVVGTSPAVNCGNRWGDYSEMTLDPAANCTFWSTNEYDNAGSQATRIFSFQVQNPNGIKNLIDLSEFKVYQSGDFVNVIANKLPSDDDVQVDMFDIAGKQLTSQKVEPVGGSVQTQIVVTGLSKGIYLVRIGNLNYQRVFKVEIN